MRSWASWWRLVPQQVSQWQDTSPSAHAARCTTCVPVDPSPRLITFTVTSLIRGRRKRAGAAEAAAKGNPRKSSGDIVLLLLSLLVLWSLLALWSLLSLLSLRLLPTPRTSGGIAQWLSAKGCDFLSLAARAGSSVDIIASAAGCLQVCVDTKLVYYLA